MNVKKCNLRLRKSVALSCVFAATLTGCATNSQSLNVEKSYLGSSKVSKEDKVEYFESENSVAGNVAVENVDNVSPFKFKVDNKTKSETMIEGFSDTTMIRLAADELPLNDFIHYVMGDVLSVSYILGDDVKNDTANLTLNLQKSVSHRKLYSLVEDLLAERGYVVRLNDGIYYINKEESGGRKNISYGYGNQLKDIPNSSQEIWQLAPFDYEFNGTLQMTLAQLAQVQVLPDSRQNLLLLKGKRSEIVKALGFMNLVDKPVFLKREIAIYRSDFLDTKTIVEKVELLMRQEGMNVGKADSINQALSIVPLDNLGAVALFANKPEVLQRALFWAKKIDQPAQGDELQYFLYPPKFSRAADLGESINVLIGGASSVGDKTSAGKESENAKKTPVSSIQGVSAANISLVVDERANSLIFYTTAEEYRKLLPLIKRLDVMPKQIMLEVVIAEVTLSDEFKMGVEFALKNGSYAASTSGALGLDKIGGLSYVLKGATGTLNMNLFEGNSLVNVLSRPSLVVRDGVSADISVGTDIPTIGQTTQDPVNGQRQTTTIEYRKTGVELEVTPTVNAQGVVIMEIRQKISNEIEAGSTVVSSPSIFERTINTEVVAESGQTIILGGLISENQSDNDSRVPFFSSIPIIGQLFKTEKRSGTKTELVMLVTPKVIESNDEWQFIKSELSQGLENLILPDFNDVNQMY